jgi:hypothetical protein
MTSRRFPAPWQVEQTPGGFKVLDAFTCHTTCAQLQTAAAFSCSDRLAGPFGGSEGVF